MSAVDTWLSQLRDAERALSNIRNRSRSSDSDFMQARTAEALKHHEEQRQEALEKLRQLGYRA